MATGRPCLHPAVWGTQGPEEARLLRPLEAQVNPWLRGSPQELGAEGIRERRSARPRGSPPIRHQAPKWVQPEHQSPWTGRRSYSRTQDLVGSGQEGGRLTGGAGLLPGVPRSIQEGSGQWTVTRHSLERAVCASWQSSGQLGAGEVPAGQ